MAQDLSSLFGVRTERVFERKELISQSQRGRGSCFGKVEAEREDGGNEERKATHASNPSCSTRLLGRRCLRHGTGFEEQPRPESTRKNGESGS